MAFVAAVLTQQVRNVLNVMKRRSVQGCAALLILGINIGAVSQQLFNDVLMAVFRRLMQRHYADAGCGINCGALSQQQFHKIKVAFYCRPVQRRFVEFVPRIDIGSPGEQKFRRIPAPVPRRPVQKRPLLHLIKHLLFDFSGFAADENGILFNQRLDLGQIPLLHRQEQRRQIVVVLGIDIGAVGQQKFCQVLGPLPGPGIATEYAERIAMKVIGSIP
jgi:hypothetical protein